jgi:hypothetical protein
MPKDNNPDNILKEAFNKTTEKLSGPMVVAAICKELKISEKTFYNYMKNPKSIKNSNLIKICILLGVDYLQLLDLTNYTTNILDIIDYE